MPSTVRATEYRTLETIEIPLEGNKTHFDHVHPRRADVKPNAGLNVIDSFVNSLCHEHSRSS